MLAILAVVVVIVGGPLRRAAIHGPEPPAPDTGEGSADLAELEAAREAKYREIRDAELDHSTGKLSDADYEAVDRALRKEAIEILRALDAARGGGEWPAEEAETGPGAGSETWPAEAANDRPAGNADNGRAGERDKRPPR